MRIGLLGCGKTGKFVEEVAKERNHKILFIVRKHPQRKIEISPEKFKEKVKKLRPDVLIDFTTPEAVLNNYRNLKFSNPVIIGTTGFSNEQLNELKNYARKKLHLIYVPTITVGINLLLSILDAFADEVVEWDSTVVETHFKEKRSTSTTAKILSAHCNSERIYSIRYGDVVEKHEVILDYKYETLRLVHESKSKKAFAFEAVRIAESLKHKYVPDGLCSVRSLFGCLSIDRQI